MWPQTSIAHPTWHNIQTNTLKLSEPSRLILSKRNRMRKRGHHIRKKARVKLDKRALHPGSAYCSLLWQITSIVAAGKWSRVAGCFCFKFSFPFCLFFCLNFYFKGEKKKRKYGITETKKVVEFHTWKRNEEVLYSQDLWQGSKHCILPAHISKKLK